MSAPPAPAVPATGRGRESFQHWRLERDAQGLAWLCFDRAGGPNVLSVEVLQELDRALEDLRALPPRGLVIYSGKPGTFIAGADIHEFPQLRSQSQAYDSVRRGQKILSAIPALGIPSVAVINGHALGGGLELALACTWRIALEADTPQLGLPEVSLGVHPGFGGTVRLPQRVGLRKAMDLMLTGRPVTTQAALRMGLVDQVVAEASWRESARKWAIKPAVSAPIGLLNRILRAPGVRGLFANSLRRRIQARAPQDHYPAPYALVDLWYEHAGATAPALEAEARSFAQLALTPTSRNLVRVFLLQDRLKRESASEAKPLHRVHVIGAGVMGGDIAAWCALRGLSVSLQDREERFLAPAFSRAEALFSRRLNPSAASAARARLVADMKGDGIAAADIVIEAVFESLEVKQALYRQIEPQLRPDAILATNTSSIPLEDLMTVLTRPERLIGLHFFNPVAKMPLVEVVKTSRTAPSAFASGRSLARQIGKTALPCRSQPGFLVNRILAPYLAEAVLLAREGVPPVEIDRSATDFGMPMGPLELADSVGLDIVLQVAKHMSAVVHQVPMPEVEALVAAGHLGQKTGRGFYLYHGKTPVRPRHVNLPTRPEAQERLVLALINEAARCLAEEVVTDADSVDAGVIFGTGFAPFRGGPLHYAQEIGVAAVVDRLRHFEQTLGPRFHPSSAWSALT